MRPALAIVAVLLLACASQIDARVQELVALKAQRVSADAAFAGMYTSEAHRALDAVKAVGGTLDDYRARMASLDALCARVTSLARAVDTAIAFAFVQINGGIVGDVGAQARSLAASLAQIIKDLGIPVGVTPPAATSSIAPATKGARP